MIFETHVHFDDEAFDEDRDEIISSLKENNIDKIVNVGASMQSTRSSYELINKFKDFYMAAGVHPNEVLDLTEKDMDELREISKHEKVVAIGEIGLEYHYLEPDKEIQKKWFLRQLDLAVELNLPVIIHSRDAALETFEIMKAYHGKIKGAIIHCYSYSKELAREYINMGYLIGVGGVVTFKNAKKLVETVEEIPIENIVVETDAPYMSPEPLRGRRNSSLNLKYIIKKIAELKGLSEEEVENKTYENAMKFFDIKA
ncbi:TatD DNase family protein [Lachnospiraceae bacterium RM5]|nr:TatD DNase family protein [Lachnospiraceae bacterium RM5]